MLLSAWASPPTPGTPQSDPAARNTERCLGDGLEEGDPFLIVGHDHTFADAGNRSPPEFELISDEWLSPPRRRDMAEDREPQEHADRERRERGDRQRRTGT